MIKLGENKPEGIEGRSDVNQLNIDDRMMEYMEGRLRGDSSLTEDQKLFIRQVSRAKKPGVDLQTSWGVEDLKDGSRANKPVSYRSSSGSSMGGWQVGDFMDQLTSRQRKHEATDKRLGAATPISIDKKQFSGKVTPTSSKSSELKLSQKPKSVTSRTIKPTSKSDKRAKAVGKSKLDSYAKVWNDNKGGIRQRYKTKDYFVKAAEDWWSKKDL